MHRPRPLTYIFGAFLALVTLYTLFAVSKTPNVSLVKHITPTQAPLAGSHPTAESTKVKEKPQHSVEKETWKPTPRPEVVGGQDREGQAGTGHVSDHSPPAPRPLSPKSSIETLIRDASRRFEETYSHRTNTLHDAAAAYRKRRGRHPPPGFERWYKYATDNDAVMVEEYFDQIYHDLNPFWAVTPKLLRAQARAGEMGIDLKDGKATPDSDWFWNKIWGRMIGEVSEFLPDMHIPINSMDESRLLVEWERIAEYMKVAEAEKVLTPPDQVVSKVQGWNASKEEDEPETPSPDWNGYGVYKYARKACPPDSPARQVGGIMHTERLVGDYLRDTSRSQLISYFDGRFVTNYTEASDYCSDATIGGLHGALIHPLSCKVTNVLLPMFGGSKFAANNEILLPAPMYWDDEDIKYGQLAGDQVDWSNKTPTVIWRGIASGGRTKPYTWNLFHRHRFVAITNSTKYNLSSEVADPIFSPFFRESSIKKLHPGTQMHLSSWLDSIHDVSFTDLVCDEVEDGQTCWYIDDEFAKTEGIKFEDQYNHKYFPDVDGNSFSGRYRAFLFSNSLPIKATIYREWHDSRLIAWKHFVPMNNRFSDYYSILEYFAGSTAAGMTGHDEQAKRIALDGRAWAEKVLRKVDMQIYVGRLLLEYARLTDDNRAVLGWVDDILSSPGS